MSQLIVSLVAMADAHISNNSDASLDPGKRYLLR